VVRGRQALSALGGSASLYGKDVRQ
jgi:hypothetical protein